MGISVVDRIVVDYMNSIDENNWRVEVDNLRIAGKLEEALLSAQKLSASFPKTSTNYFMLGDVLMQLSRYDDAVSAYMAGRNIELSVPMGYRKAAEALLHLGRDEEAVKQLARAKLLQPSEIAVYLRIADIHRRNGRKDFAIQEISDAFNIAKRHAADLSRVAKAFLALGETGLAMEAFAYLRRMEPNNPEGYFGAVDELVKQGREEEIQFILAAFKKEFAGDPGSMFRLMEMLFSAGKRVEAAEVASGIIDVMQWDLPHCFRLGDICLTYGNVEAGFEYYRRGFLLCLKSNTFSQRLLFSLTLLRQSPDRQRRCAELIDSLNLRPVSGFTVTMRWLIISIDIATRYQVVMANSIEGSDEFELLMRTILGECCHQMRFFTRALEMLSVVSSAYPEDEYIKNRCIDASVRSERVEERMRRGWQAAPTVPLDQQEVYSDPARFKNIDVFIKTYKGDARWLTYCLRSINKFMSGIRHIHIVADSGDNMDIPNIDGIYYHERPLPNIVASWGNNPFGYWWQMGMKLNWIEFTDADAVIILDSDCIINGPLDVGLWFSDGAPAWVSHSWKYSQIGYIWKPSVDYFMGLETEFSHMCRNGFILTREATLGFHDFMMQEFQQTPLQYVSDVTHPVPPEEYEMFGAYLRYYRRHGYRFVDSSVARQLHPLPMVQFWSWGGVSEEIEAKIEEFLQS